jgi:hypothetical protein
VTDATRRPRRGVVVAVAVIAVVAVVGAVVLFVRARQVDRTVEALCAELSEAQDLDQSLTTLDPATLAPQVRALRRAREVAPTEIEPAVSTLADFVVELAAEVDEAEGDRTEAFTLALEARQDRVDTVTEAGADVQAWAQANCGLALVGATTTTTSADASDGGSGTTTLDSDGSAP